MYPLIHVQVVNWIGTAENSCNWNDCVAGDDCGSTQLRDVPFHQRIWTERSGRQAHQSHRRLLWTRGEPSDPETNEAQWATVFPWKSTARCKVTYSNSFASTILLVNICGYGSLGSPCIRKCFQISDVCSRGHAGLGDSQFPWTAVRRELSKLQFLPWSTGQGSTWTPSILSTRRSITGTFTHAALYDHATFPTVLRRCNVLLQAQYVIWTTLSESLFWTIVVLRGC